MKIIEKVYIGCAIFPLIGSIFLVTGIFDLIFGRSGSWIVLSLLPDISLVLTVLGIVLTVQAQHRKIPLWPLVLATLMASSYYVLVIGHIHFRIF